MLLLTSTNDRLQVITSSAATIDCHTSWVDTSAGTITPGRTNTPISAAATTSIAGAPAASTQRNVKTIHIRNKHATLACDVTVQHTDGTTVSQLYKATLDPGAALEYTDQAGFGGGRVAPVSGGGLNPTRQIFLTGSGTYTTPVGVLWLDVRMCGAGAGGGASVAGSNGGNTVFGSLTANGGASSAFVAAAGDALGGTATGGDINIKGGDGQAGQIADTTRSAPGGDGGANPFGGAGRGVYGAAGGVACPNTGAGGGGGGLPAIGPVLSGGGGGAGGYLEKIIGTPAATYSYAVGAGGAGAASGGGYFAAGAGADGIIIVTEHYR